MSIKTKFLAFYKKIPLRKTFSYNGFKKRVIILNKFKLLIALYLLAWWFWIVLRNSECYYIKLVDEQWRMGKGFYKNWLTAFTEDLLFFGLGFFGLIIGTKLPRDESFNVRVASLANGSFANKEAEAFLKTKIETLLSYNKNFHSVITIQKVDQSKKFAFIHIDNECQIVNMCEDERIPREVFAEVVPGPKIENTYGYIYNLSIKHEVNKKSKVINKLPDEIFFLPQGQIIDLNDEPNNKFDKKWDVELLEDGYIRWKFCYSMWVPLDGDFLHPDNFYSFEFISYTQNFQLTIKNMLPDTDLFYVVTYNNRNFVTDNKPNLTIDKNKIPSKTSNIAISNLKFNKQDKVEFHLTTLKPDNKEQI